MKKIIVENESTLGLILKIEHESGKDVYSLTVGYTTFSVAKEELYTLQSMIAEILEN